MAEPHNNKRAREDGGPKFAQRPAKRLAALSYLCSDALWRTEANESRFDYNNLITVLVGPEGAEKNFVVHKDIICAHSKFFAAACSECWIEGQKKVVHIREHDPMTFQAYMAWLSTHTVNVRVQALPEGTELCQQMRFQQTQLIDLYLLGDFVDDLQLRNNVTMALVHETSVLPSPSNMARIWNFTLPNNPLRRMYIDRAIMRTNREDIIGLFHKHPVGFVHDLAASLLRQKPTHSHKQFVARRDEYLEAEDAANQA